MMLTAQMVKDFAEECGADDVGIAPLDRFEGAPIEMDPRFIYPGAKSLIGLLFRIPRGYSRGPEEGTHFYQYPSLGYGGINEDFAPQVIYETGRFIEDHGYEAAVYRNTGGRALVSDMDGTPGFKQSSEEHKRAVTYSVPARDGFPSPDILFQFRIAAFLCGLGEIGYSKMFLSRKFGPRPRFAFILTDAELEPDPIYDGPPLCDRCMACVAACPGKCISPRETVSVTLAGRKVEWGKLNEWDCYIYYMGGNKETNPFLPRNAYDALPDGDKLLRGEKHITAEEFGPYSKLIRTFYPGALYGYAPSKCGGCLRACIDHMERKDRLNKKFKNPFRTGKPWKLPVDPPANDTPTI